jgi:hypothetical protein
VPRNSLIVISLPRWLGKQKSGAGCPICNFISISFDRRDNLIWLFGNLHGNRGIWGCFVCFARKIPPQIPRSLRNPKDSLILLDSLRESIVYKPGQVFMGRRAIWGEPDCQATFSPAFFPARQVSNCAALLTAKNARPDMAPGLLCGINPRISQRSIFASRPK